MIWKTNDCDYTGCLFNNIPPPPPSTCHNNVGNHLIGVEHS